jgi:hypothetical protein
VTLGRDLSAIALAKAGTRTRRGVEKMPVNLAHSHNGGLPPKKASRKFARVMLEPPPPQPPNENITPSSRYTATSAEHGHFCRNIFRNMLRMNRNTTAEIRSKRSRIDPILRY